MPESFIPIWLSVGEAENLLDDLTDLGMTPGAEWPERSFSIVEDAIDEEKPLSFEQFEEAREHLGRRFGAFTDEELDERRGGAAERRDERWQARDPDSNTREETGGEDGR